LAEVAVERIEVDVLDRLVMEMKAVQFAATLGLADEGPVGGTVAGAGEAGALDEGLQENGADAYAESRSLELVLVVEGGSR